MIGALLCLAANNFSTVFILKKLTANLATDSASAEQLDQDLPELSVS